MPRELKPCGTPAAAKRHRRRKEPVCPACVAAEAEYQREYWVGYALLRKKVAR